MARKILAARDAMVRDSHPEAWHPLYSIADATFTASCERLDDLNEHRPWNALERVAGIRAAAPAAPEDDQPPSQERAE